MVVQLGLLVASWYMVAPGKGWGLPRILYLLGALAWYPVLYQLRVGQPVMIVVFAVAACWRLAESGRPWLAGVVLRMRGAPLARVIALGVVGSMLSIPYDHLHDFAVLVPAALLFLRTDPPVWQRAWLLVMWLTLETMWAITPLPLLIAQAVWLAMIALPRRSQTRTTLGAASEAA
jgi:hypothetical protein